MIFTMMEVDADADKYLAVSKGFQCLPEAQVNATLV